LDVKGADRQRLVIDPAPARYRARRSTRVVKDARYAFDTGTCFGKHVWRGELRTDDEGRVIPTSLHRCR
jgi:hypothetical protein